MMFLIGMMASRFEIKSGDLASHFVHLAVLQFLQYTAYCSTASVGP
jgi:hypothetical protein